MEDEGLLLSNPAPRARRGRSPGSQLGVDVVRIHARWWEIAPDGRRRDEAVGLQRRQPQRPAATSWATLDTAVAIVRAAGHEGDAHDHRPRAAVGEHRAAQAQPALEAGADGVRGLRARRRHALQGPGRPLPALERAQPAGLAAAAVGVHSRRRNCKPVSPHVYRALVRAAEPAVHAADPGAEVVIGELAPVGNPPISAQHADAAAAVPARDGLRRRPATGRSRTGRCKGFKAAKADSFGYHPHPLLQRARTSVNPDPDEAQFADLKRLFTRARQAARAQAPADRQEHPPDRVRLPDHPPDPAVGIPRRCRRTTCSRPPTSRGAPSACAACPSTSGTTSRSSTAAAAPSATRAGRPACASTTASPSRCSRRCPRRS